MFNSYKIKQDRYKLKMGLSRSDYVAFKNEKDNNSVKFFLKNFAVRTEKLQQNL